LAISKIFISYRRADASAYAGWLHNALKNELGSRTLFLDIKNVPPGLPWGDYLNRQLSACDIFLAVIGPNWLDAKDERGNRRLDDPEDRVAGEIEAALKRRDIPVVPILVDGAPLPTKQQLPERLKDLVDRESVEVRYRQFDRDVQELAHAIRNAIREKQAWPVRWSLAAVDYLHRKGAVATAGAVAGLILGLTIFYLLSPRFDAVADRQAKLPDVAEAKPAEDARRAATAEDARKAAEAKAAEEARQAAAAKAAEEARQAAAAKAAEEARQAAAEKAAAEKAAAEKAAEKAAAEKAATEKAAAEKAAAEKAAAEKAAAEKAAAEKAAEKAAAEKAAAEKAAAVKAAAEKAAAEKAAAERAAAEKAAAEKAAAEKAAAEKAAAERAAAEKAAAEKAAAEKAAAVKVAATEPAAKVAAREPAAALACEERQVIAWLEQHGAYNGQLDTSIYDDAVRWVARGEPPTKTRSQIAKEEADWRKKYPEQKLTPQTSSTAMVRGQCVLTQRVDSFKRGSDGSRVNNIFRIVYTIRTDDPRGPRIVAQEIELLRR
jgi:hypothetical protein